MKRLIDLEETTFVWIDFINIGFGNLPYVDKAQCPTIDKIQFRSNRNIDYFMVEEINENNKNED